MNDTSSTEHLKVEYVYCFEFGKTSDAFSIVGVTILSTGAVLVFNSTTVLALLPALACALVVAPRGP